MTNPLKKKPRMNKKKIQPFIFVVKNKMYRTPIKTWKEQFMKPKTGRSNYMDWTYVTPMEQGVNMVPNYDTRQDPYADFKNYVDHVMSAPQGRKHRPKRKKSRKTRGFQPTTVQQPVQQAPVAQPVQQPVEDDVEEEVVEDYQPIEQIQPIPQQVPVQAPPVVQQPQQPVQQAPPQPQPQVQAPIQPVQPIPVQAPVQAQPVVQQPQQPAPAPIPEVQPQPVQEAAPEEEDVAEQVPQQVVQPQVQTQGMFADGDYEYDTYTDSDA